MSLSAARERALGSTLVVVTTSDRLLAPALEAARREIDAIDRACSRFREDSELTRLNAGVGDAHQISPLLFEAIGIAMRAAAQSGGIVDPTVGASLSALGYDRDFRSVVRDGPELRGPLPRSARWREIELDPAGSTARFPVGVALDLGATAKALAADRAAAAAHRETGGGVLVSIGGDVATAGPAPDDGWRVRVQDDHTVADDASSELVSIASGAVATSGTAARRWRRGSEEMHHLIDPVTARPARSCWRTVTVAAATCVDANVASTASMVIGAAADRWLADRALPARLVAIAGDVVRVAGWPEPAPDLRRSGGPGW